MSEANVTPEAPEAVSAGPAGVFLLEEARITENGESVIVDLGPLSGKLVSVVLGILRSIEQQSLEVSIWGSDDGQTWSEKPLLLMPQKFYAGTSEMLIDLEAQPAIRYLRAKWAVNRWGKGDQKPDFNAYLFLRPS